MVTAILKHSMTTLGKMRRRSKHKGEVRDAVGALDLMDSGCPRR